MEAARSGKRYSQSRQGFSQWVYIPRKVSEVKEESDLGQVLSLEAPLFSLPSCDSWLSARFLHKAKKLIYRHQQYRYMRNEKCCDVFILWKTQI